MLPCINLIRHGETAWSLSGQYSGRADISLTAQGEAEARNVGQRLRDIPFAHVLTSPLRRAHPLCYSAGVMVLSQEHPRVILHRSVEPVLTPRLKEERHDTVPNVVFPTGIDRRDDPGQPDRIDVYYGMADSRIGVARLDVPEHLPPGAPADGNGSNAGGQE